MEILATQPKPTLPAPPRKLKALSSSQMWAKEENVEGRAGERRQKPFWSFEITNLGYNLNETCQWHQKTNILF